MKVILGLGNPGLRYRFSRHNLGFLAVESLARAKKIKINQKAFNCLLGYGITDKQKLILGLPLTFMNLSAQAVVPLVKRKRLKPADLLIVCDDVDLPLGRMRIRAKGSDGGHKGLRSIIEGLKSRDFARLRIGIGSCAQNRGGLRAYVLERFKKKEIKIVDEVIAEAVSCCETWAEAGIIAAMNRFNRRQVNAEFV